jgi:uncharacterized protein YxjI
MLNRKTYFIREHVGLLKLSNTYDILDPETGNQIGIAREKPGGLILALRFLINKRLLPTRVFVYEGSDSEDESRLLFSIRRGFSFMRAMVTIIDSSGNTAGRLLSKMFSIGGAFRVLDTQGTEVALVKGDWKGWNFTFTDAGGNEIGTITKKWAGLGKELLTSADNYVIALNETAPQSGATLLLAAGLAVDTVYKSR